LKQHEDVKAPDGRKAVVRNGHLARRSVQTRVGDIEAQAPKVRDRSGSGIRFNSQLLQPHLKRARSLEELIPWLYPRGVSSGDFQAGVLERPAWRAGQRVASEQGLPAQGAVVG